MSSYPYEYKPTKLTRNNTISVYVLHLLTNGLPIAYVDNNYTFKMLMYGEGPDAETLQALEEELTRRSISALPIPAADAIAAQGLLAEQHFMPPHPPQVLPPPLKRGRQESTDNDIKLDVDRVYIVCENYKLYDRKYAMADVGGWFVLDKDFNDKLLEFAGSAVAKNIRVILNIKDTDEPHDMNSNSEVFYDASDGSDVDDYWQKYMLFVNLNSQLYKSVGDDTYKIYPIHKYLSIIQKQQMLAFLKLLSARIDSYHDFYDDLNKSQKNHGRTGQFVRALDSTGMLSDVFLKQMFLKIIKDMRVNLPPSIERKLLATVDSILQYQTSTLRFYKSTENCFYTDKINTLKTDRRILWFMMYLLKTFVADVKVKNEDNLLYDYVEDFFPMDIWFVVDTFKRIHASPVGQNVVFSKFNRDKKQIPYTLSVANIWDASPILKNYSYIRDEDILFDTKDDRYKVESSYCALAGDFVIRANKAESTTDVTIIKKREDTKQYRYLDFIKSSGTKKTSKNGVLQCMWPKDKDFQKVEELDPDVLDMINTGELSAEAPRSGTHSGTVSGSDARGPAIRPRGGAPKKRPKVPIGSTAQAPAESSTGQTDVCKSCVFGGCAMDSVTRSVLLDMKRSGDGFLRAYTKYLNNTFTKPSMTTSPATATAPDAHVLLTGDLLNFFQSILTDIPVIYHYDGDYMFYKPEANPDKMMPMTIPLNLVYQNFENTSVADFRLSPLFNSVEYEIRREIEIDVKACECCGIENHRTKFRCNNNCLTQCGSCERWYHFDCSYLKDINDNKILKKMQAFNNDLYKDGCDKPSEETFICKQCQCVPSLESFTVEKMIYSTCKICGKSDSSEMLTCNMPGCYRKMHKSCLNELSEYYTNLGRDGKRKAIHYKLLDDKFTCPLCWVNIDETEEHNDIIIRHVFGNILDHNKIIRLYNIKHYQALIEDALSRASRARESHIAAQQHMKDSTLKEYFEMANRALGIQLKLVTYIQEFRNAENGTTIILPSYTTVDNAIKVSMQNIIQVKQTLENSTKAANSLAAEEIVRIKGEDMQVGGVVVNVTTLGSLPSNSPGGYQLPTSIAPSQDEAPKLIDKLFNELLSIDKIEADLRNFEYSIEKLANLANLATLANNIHTQTAHVLCKFKTRSIMEQISNILQRMIIFEQIQGNNIVNNCMPVVKNLEKNIETHLIDIINDIMKDKKQEETPTRRQPRIPASLPQLSASIIEKIQLINMVDSVFSGSMTVYDPYLSCMMTSRISSLHKIQTHLETTISTYNNFIKNIAYKHIFNKAVIEVVYWKLVYSIEWLATKVQLEFNHGIDFTNPNINSKTYDELMEINTLLCDINPEVRSEKDFSCMFDISRCMDPRLLEGYYLGAIDNIFAELEGFKDAINSSQDDSILDIREFCEEVFSRHCFFKFGLIKDRLASVLYNKLAGLQSIDKVIYDILKGDIEVDVLTNLDEAETLVEKTFLPRDQLHELASFANSAVLSCVYDSYENKTTIVDENVVTIGPVDDETKLLTMSEFISYVMENTYDGPVIILGKFASHMLDDEIKRRRCVNKFSDALAKVPPISHDRLAANAYIRLLGHKALPRRLPPLENPPILPLENPPIPKNLRAQLNKIKIMPRAAGGSAKPTLADYHKKYYPSYYKLYYDR